MVKVKICGITNLEDALLACDLGANAVGFIFYEKSKRHVTPATAQAIVNALPPLVIKVGVFVNAPVTTINETARFVGLNLVQLHGDETPEICEKIIVPLLKAFRIKNDFDVNLLGHYPVSNFLLDGYHEKQYGGAGNRFDWEIARRAKKFGRIVLSGGLNAKNVRDAVATVQPYAVDVCSGVEASPGRKAADKLRAFFGAVQSDQLRLCQTLPDAVIARSEATKQSSDSNTNHEIASLKSARNDKSLHFLNSPDVEEQRDTIGHFGIYGGKFVPEILVPVLTELQQAYTDARHDRAFQDELNFYLREYSGRPTPLTFAKNLSGKLAGAKIFLKREDLNHTGAHKINNCLGQILLARKMGKKRIIAETGAGQHGVAVATVAAKFGMQSVIYMGKEDTQRQSLNVFRMRLLGGEVIPVKAGSRTLKDAINEAIRDWVSNVHDTFYLIGSVVGPHPYPTMVRDFQSVIGWETRRQILEMQSRLPDYALACVGGGSNAIGMFYPFLEDKQVKLIGVEAAGLGLNSGRHSATLAKGSPGVLHGAYSYLLQNADGQISEVHSISAGLDYPGVGPEHSYLKDCGRVEYKSITDDEALEAFALLSQTEGIIPALESAHAVAQAVKLAPKTSEKEMIVICLSGRGDKDVELVEKNLLHKESE